MRRITEAKKRYVSACASARKAMDAYTARAGARSVVGETIEALGALQRAAEDYAGILSVEVTELRYTDEDKAVELDDVVVDVLSVAVKAEENIETLRRLMK